jgi:2-methylisocitrate lyase-like PEP mutase family enzyme
VTRQEQKAAAFHALHAAEPFVMPNPRDPGSARMLEALGVEGLATTSSGFAFTLGRRDGEATLDEVLEHTAALDRATVLPLSVDLEAARVRPRPGSSAQTQPRGFPASEPFGG